MNQKKKTTTVMLILIAILLLISVSYIKFNTFNFIKTSSSIFKILSGNAVVVQVNSNPNIYISSPNKSTELLKEFMENEGYEYLPDERMSSTLVFKDNNRKIYVEFSLNRYYGMWAFAQD
jgi:hypothetical protein